LIDDRSRAALDASPQTINASARGQPIQLLSFSPAVDFVDGTKKVVCNNILGDLSKKIDDLSVELTHTQARTRRNIQNSSFSSFSLHFFFVLLFRVAP
jgi:hypothetical protein